LVAGRADHWVVQKAALKVEPMAAQTVEQRAVRLASWLAGNLVASTADSMVGGWVAMRAGC